MPTRLVLTVGVAVCLWPGLWGSPVRASLTRPGAPAVTRIVESDDDIVEDEVPEVPAQVPWQAVDDASYRLVFGGGNNATTARVELELVLRRQLDAVQVICNLTGDQRRKLELGGRGDIERLLMRVGKLQTRLERAGDDPQLLGEIRHQAHELQRGVKTALARDASVFHKVRRRFLTPLQNSRFDLVREIERSGGRTDVDSIGPHGGLEISVAGLPFGDENCEQLKLLPELRSLDLTSTRVTTAGLVHLESLTALYSLNLTGTKISNAGLASVARMKSLERLDLFGTPVSSEGLFHLQDLTELEELVLSDTRVGDAGLAPLGKLKKLHSLNLHGTQVTDAGLTSLRDLSHLEWLDVSGTQVSDAGLAQLKGARKLQWVNLSSTQVTDAGLADLKRALPGANIWKRPSQSNAAESPAEDPAGADSGS